MTLQQRIQQVLQSNQWSTQTREQAYWNLRNSGFNNIEAENFIALRLHWFD